MSERQAAYVTRRRLPGMAGLPAQPKPRGGNKPYRVGADAERELVREFFLDGALALRSAGSAGPFDIAVCLPNGGRLLQVKWCGTAPTPYQIAAWLAHLPPVPDGWTAELWYRTPRGWQSVMKEDRR